MHEEPFSVASEGFRIRGVLTRPGGCGTVPAVILCHGLYSHKDSAKYRRLSERLAQEGIASLRFDFRGCGQSEGTLSESTVSGRLKDLEAVKAFAIGLGWIAEPIGLMGSSLGGFISLLHASQDEKVGAVAVWATPFLLDGVAASIKEDPNHPGEAFLIDLGRHDLGKALSRIRRLLVIHGGRDELVPPWHAERIYGMASRPRRIHVIPEADHRISELAHREKAVELTVGWFMEHLSLGR